MVDAGHQADLVELIFDQARKEARAWRDRVPRRPISAGSYELEVERLGLCGAIDKRIAELRINTKDQMRAFVSWRESRKWYREAIERRKREVQKICFSHWVLTHYLSLSTMLGEKADPKLWTTARQMAQGQLDQDSPIDQAWAHATLAELDLLAIAYGEGDERDPARIRERVVEHCREIRRLVGDESFQVYSTRRQFQRYIDWWKREEWQDITRGRSMRSRPDSRDLFAYRQRNCQRENILPYLSARDPEVL